MAFFYGIIGVTTQMRWKRDLISPLPRSRVTRACSATEINRSGGSARKHHPSPSQQKVTWNRKCSIQCIASPQLNLLRSIGDLDAAPCGADQW